ncbi:hypothetical protein DEJ50_20140 [Streptomyces venezuelae]|uniref:Extensin n=1 Tax=Streptomyces venezuelae TaxID=54571 RepID=A0A5P2D3P4_STRVZ|nr:hypothetical protein [Streptomyces venezuelae]QES49782.1 hypothetical protein DEJ50_20140 [Streptomyces venezuelae]
MADDRNNWLDEAAAEKLLRGEPVGPVADHPDRDEAARLRQALEDLAPRPLAPGAELPGEAAALAAFRAATHAVGTAAGTTPEAEAESVLGSAVEPEPLVALGMPGEVRPARNRTFRLGLAAAVASVAIGGIAAVAGGALLDRALHTSAGPAPAVSLTTGPTPLQTPDAADGAVPPGITPDAGPTPFRDGGGHGTTPAPGGDGAATPGTGGTANIGGTVGGTTGEDDRDRPDATGGTDGTRKDPDGSAAAGADGNGGGKDRDRVLRIADLCRDFRAGRLADDQRDRLARAAKGAQRIKQFCDRLLDGGSGGSDGSRGPGSDGSGEGGEILEAPTREPAAPVPPAALENALGLTQDTRL